jgi:pyruvate dehydrogenase E2 component (dihydrolipoamide acetyltransferase)
MATEIFMPKMGYDMTEGKLVRWLKQEGDAVSKGEPVAEIETDKVVIEVEAFVAGVLRRIEVPEGQTVPVGTRIGIVAGEGEELPAADAGPNRSPDASAVASGKPAAPVAPSSPPAAASRRPTGADGAANASPLARRLAQELGVDLSTVTGSGPGGKISREDVLAAVAASSGEGDTSTQTASPTQSSAVQAPEDLPLSRLRQTMGRRMVESKTQAPHFYLTMRVDMSEAMALRQRLNAKADEALAKVSVNDLIVKATAGALRDFPTFNATFAGDHLTAHKAIAINIAVAIDDGLVTPVLHDVDQKPLAQIATESSALVERTRAGKNRPEDFDGGTFTVSNLGMYQVDTFTAIINPPQAAILAAGAVQRTPVYVGDNLVPRDMLSLTLSTDHRIADGVTAARFLGAIRERLEQPEKLV